MQRFRLQNGPDDIWVIDADTDQPLGYFFPPIPGEVYAQTFEPEQIINLDDFPAHRNLKFFSILYFNLEPEWEQLGFSIEQALPWKHRGRKPEQAAPWQALGMSYEEHGPWVRKRCDAIEAGQWIEEGYIDPNNNPWLKLGIHYADAQPWIQAGIDTRQAREWCKAGFDVNSVNDWSAVGLKTPGEARLWRDSKKMTPEQFQDWYTPWQAVGFSIATALGWQDDYGISDPQEAQILSGLSIDWEIVEIWQRYGYSIQQMSEHLNAGGDLCPPEYYEAQQKDVSSVHF